MALADGYWDGSDSQKLRASQAAAGPYRGNLNTDFSNLGGAYTYDRGGGLTGFGSNYQNALNRLNQLGSDSDADVRGAASAAWELANPNLGTSSAEQQALLNTYKSRIGIKNSLAEQIANSGNQLDQTQNLLRGTADQTLGQGIKNTRENYNRRGLLYSGLRQGGEQQIRGAVAGQLASGLSGSQRESANSLSAAQNAYGSVDLANQQDALNMANQAFDTANANNIARIQAMQQLGYGVGQAAGYLSGSQQQPQQPQGPNNYSVGRQQTISPQIGY